MKNPSCNDKDFIKRSVVRLFWAIQNVKVLLKGQNCGDISGFVGFLVLFGHMKDFLPAMRTECRYLANVNFQLSPVSVMGEIRWRDKGSSHKICSKGSFNLHSAYHTNSTIWCDLKENILKGVSFQRVQLEGSVLNQFWAQDKTFPHNRDTSLQHWLWNGIGRHWLASVHKM